MRNSENPEPSNADSLERRNWGNVFNLLVQMVKNQQNQLQSFANQQKFLEDRLNMQNQRWASDLKLYKDQISQVKMYLIFEKKKRVLEAAKADLLMGYMHREASVLKWKLDGTQEDLEDFKSVFDCLSLKGTSSNGKTSSSKTAGKESSPPDETKDERNRLKVEFEKQNSELLALLQEKNFVWNQFNKMETDYSNKLKSKQDEVIKANEKINILVSSMEELQSENSKKDSRISELESKMADMDVETNRLNKEISGLSAELESLRKLKNNEVKPFLNRSRDSGTTESNRSRRNITLDKEKGVCTPVQLAYNTSTKSSENEKRSLKRKETPVIPTSETVKLFSSGFKVPKLKSSSRTR